MPSSVPYYTESAISPLLTDLYQLTMGAAYFASGKTDRATFSLFIRESPYTKRNFYVAAGLNMALETLRDLKFTDNDLDYLKSTGLFKADFLAYLKDFQFSGDLWALPEGSIFFANEPILEITAPVIEAQLVETLLINLIGFQTMVASKAARCVYAAKGRPVMDFGLRRAHGKDAGMLAARSTYLAGFGATSNVLAGKKWGIPVSGTMAHSYVMAFENEEAAFLAFAKDFGSKSVFLIDTYDTLEGARIAAKVANQMREKEGTELLGVRIDSGDMVNLSRKVRTILDDAGCQTVKIFVSSGFDEFKIQDALRKGAAIDAFGVGNKVAVSADEPYLNIVYKMVHFGTRPVHKKSPGKKTLAGQKQLYRQFNSEGVFTRDTIGLRDESIPDSQVLLKAMMRKGQMYDELLGLEDIRARLKKQFDLLPDQYKVLEPLLQEERYPVMITPKLTTLQKGGQSSS